MSDFPTTGNPLVRGPWKVGIRAIGNKNLHFVDQAMGAWLSVFRRLSFPGMKSIEDNSFLESGCGSISPQAVFPKSKDKFVHRKPGTDSLYGFVCRSTVADSDVRVKPYTFGGGEWVVCMDEAAF
jgi:hypothetical protein